MPAAKLDRLSTCYAVNPETRALEFYDGLDDSQWSRPPAFPDAGGDLVSTIDDYLAFGQMMWAGQVRARPHPVEAPRSNS